MRAATTGVLSAIASMSTSGVTSPAGSSSASAASRHGRDVGRGPRSGPARHVERARLIAELCGVRGVGLEPDYGQLGLEPRSRSARTAAIATILALVAVDGADHHQAHRTGGARLARRGIGRDRDADGVGEHIRACAANA